MRIRLPHAPRALNPVLLALCCGLTACGTDGPLVASAAPGTGSGSAASVGTAAAPGTAASAAGGPSSATLSAAGSNTLQIGAKKIEVAGGVFDPKCAEVVAPFDVTDNFTELTKLGTGMALDAAGTLIGDKAKQLGDAAAGNRTTAAPTKVAPLSPALRRAAKRMNWLPMSVEDRYGAYLLGEMKPKLMPREGKVGPRFYPKADALLAEVLAGVKVPYAYKFEVFISTDAGENAMALPGGRIVIDKALVEKPELRDKAYFAVAHEVGHVLQRHQTRALQSRIIDALALKGSVTDMVKTMKSANSQPQAVAQLLIGGKLLFEKHSEQQELQADSCGMRMLDDGKTSDSRLLAAVKAFSLSLPKPQPPVKQDDTLAQVIDVVQRPVDAHPSSEERKKNLDTMLAELRQRPGMSPPPKPAGTATRPAGTTTRPATLPTLPAGGRPNAG